MTPEELKIILEKYKLGQCSPNELLVVNQFFKATENHSISVFESESDQKRIEVDLRNSIEMEIEEEFEEKPSLFTKINRFKFAAAAILVLGIGLGFLFFSNSLEKSTIELVTYQTYQANKQDITLNDGTKVHLNTGSIFKAPKTFSGDNRKVYLEGEAFFEVAKNEKMPFLIISNKLTTQVIGTSFNVKAYPNSRNIEVAVMTGKVKVFDKEKEVYLTRNQKVIYEKTLKNFEKKEVAEIENYNAWMKGTLVFEKKSMEEIIEDLNRHFKVEIILEGEKLKKCELNVRFENDSLDTILQILSSYTDAKFTKNGNKIVIKGKGC